MSEIVLSKYQEEIIDYFENNPGKNMLIEALAGCSKTFTITKMTEKTTTSDIYLAFNNAIAEECRGKITNPKTKVYTTYSLGLQIMNYNLNPNKGGIGKTRASEDEKAQLDNLKIHKIVDDMITTAYGRRFDWDERIFLKNNYVQLYNLARLGCCLDDKDKIKRLVDDHGLFIDLENGFAAPDYTVICGWIWDIDKESLEQFENYHVIDFTDMLYITIKKIKEGKWKVAPWQFFTNIYLDECIPGEFKVKTESGYSPNLHSLYNQYKKGKQLPLIKSFNENTQQFEYKKIKSVSYKGERQTYLITTEGLTKTRATDNHKFLTQRGWVPVSELEVGKDYLILDEIENQKTKYVLNDDQLQFVLASSIGDGHLSKQSDYHTYRIVFNQGDKQYNYFHFKKWMINATFERKGISGYTGKKSTNGTSSKVFILPDDKWNLIPQLDERFLAIWYQDDGSLNKRIYVDKQEHVIGITIACNNLTEEQVDLLLNIIYNKYEIELDKFKSKDKYWTIRSSNIKSAQDFLRLIAPYMNEDCAYKNPYYDANNLYQWNNKFKAYGANYIKSITPYKTEPVYDIEVEDNHNFVCGSAGLRPGAKVSGVVVHNCQDFNMLQFELVKLIKRKNGRYIWTGDENQAIYNFAQAEAHCFKIIKNLFKPIKTFELPINYRCPASHLKYVNNNFGIPIQARPNAPEGEIKHIEKEEIIKYVQPGDMIISRKNKWFAPLLLQLASNGIPIYIEDKEMVESIKKLIKAQKVEGCSGLKFKFESILKEYLEKIQKIIAIAQGKETNQNIDIEEASAKVESLSGKLDNINFVMALLDPYMEKNKNSTVNKFTTYLDTILNTTPSKKCVRICSVHKAKGLEAPNVFVLNEANVCIDFRMSPEQREQEVNLAYISVTRAMDTLYLVTEEDA